MRKKKKGERLQRTERVASEAFAEGRRKKEVGILSCNASKRIHIILGPGSRILARTQEEMRLDREGRKKGKKREEAADSPSGRDL